MLPEVTGPSAVPAKNSDRNVESSAWVMFTNTEWVGHTHIAQNRDTLPYLDWGHRTAPDKDLLFLMGLRLQISSELTHCSGACSLFHRHTNPDTFPKLNESLWDQWFHEAKKDQDCDSKEDVSHLLLSDGPCSWLCHVLIVMGMCQKEPVCREVRDGPAVRRLLETQV